MLEIFKKRQKELQGCEALPVLDIEAEQPAAALERAGRLSIYMQGILDSDSRNETERRLQARQITARIFTEAEARKSADAATKKRVQNAVAMERAALAESSVLLKLLQENWEGESNFLQ